MMDNEHKSVLISQIEQQCFHDAWSERSIYHTISNAAAVCVTNIMENKLIGYAFGILTLNECELYRIAVSPDFRQQGYGEELLKSFIAESVNRGGERIFLEVNAENTPANSLYKKIGFKEIAVRKKYYGDDDAIIYEYNPFSASC